jgi:hypothetical protein
MPTMRAMRERCLGWQSIAPTTCISTGRFANGGLFVRVSPDGSSTQINFPTGPTDNAQQTADTPDSFTVTGDGTILFGNNSKIWRLRVGDTAAVAEVGAGGGGNYCAGFGLSYVGDRLTAPCDGQGNYQNVLRLGEGLGPITVGPDGQIRLFHKGSGSTVQTKSAIARIGTRYLKVSPPRSQVGTTFVRPTEPFATALVQRANVPSVDPFSNDPVEIETDEQNRTYFKVIDPARGYMIVRIETSGARTAVAGGGTINCRTATPSPCDTANTSATSIKFDSAFPISGFTIASDGTLVVASGLGGSGAQTANILAKITTDGIYSKLAGGNGGAGVDPPPVDQAAAQAIVSPEDVVLTSTGEPWFVGKHRLSRLTSAGRVITVAEDVELPGNDGELNTLRIDNNDNVYYRNPVGRFTRVSPTGVLTEVNLGVPGANTSVGPDDGRSFEVTGDGTILWSASARIWSAKVGDTGATGVVGAGGGGNICAGGNTGVNYTAWRLTAACDGENLNDYYGVLNLGSNPGPLAIAPNGRVSVFHKGVNGSPRFSVDAAIAQTGPRWLQISTPKRNIGTGFPPIANTGLTGTIKRLANVGTDRKYSVKLVASGLSPGVPITYRVTSPGHAWRAQHTRQHRTAPQTNGYLNSRTRVACSPPK